MAGYSYPVRNVMGLAHLETLLSCDQRYQDDLTSNEFCCHDEWLAMAFAKLTSRKFARLGVFAAFANRAVYQMGSWSDIWRIRSPSNKFCGWLIYSDWAQSLILRVYKLEPIQAFTSELELTVYTHNESVIDLCLSFFACAYYWSTKAEIKLYRLLDLRGSIPSWLVLREGVVCYGILPDKIPNEPDAIYVMHRCYLDFARMARSLVLGHISSSMQRPAIFCSHPPFLGSLHRLVVLSINNPALALFTPRLNQICYAGFVTPCRTWAHSHFPCYQLHFYRSQFYIDLRRW